MDRQDTSGFVSGGSQPLLEGFLLCVIEDCDCPGSAMSNRYNLFGLTAKEPSLNNPSKPISIRPEIRPETDTTLRLVSPGTKRKWEDVNGVMTFSRSAPLALGIPRSPSTSESSKRSSGTVCTASSLCVAEEECSKDLDLNFHLELEPKNAPIIVKPAVDLQLSLSVGPSVSVVTSETGAHSQSHHLLHQERPIVTIEDGSVSSYRIRQTTTLPLIYKPGTQTLPLNQDLSSVLEATPPKKSVDSATLTIEKQIRNISTKYCQFPGCSKGARGASGLCIAHGGGRRCQKAGCHKGAEGKTIYCKLHGGGRRCDHLGCTKSAEGRTDFCIAHGGGRRCSEDGCSRASRGKSGLCIRHGGGRRCRKESCNKSAEGQSGLCIAHGGGRRCQFLGCAKGAQGSTMFCKAHGGGKRCSFPECGKGAEGSTSYCKAHGGGKRCLFQGGGLCPKSVHGGTPFCVAHGGGKRCASPNCTKSARGRTEYCVRHGGGKRCQSDGCGKSAQGSTEFCKAHGGGKRCSWGQRGSEFGSGGPVCDRFSRGKGGLCAAHSALVQDHQVHGGETIRTITAQRFVPVKADKLKGVLEEEDGGPVIRGAETVPEGRVHGGGLMALLARGGLLDQAEGCSTSNEASSSYNLVYGFL